MKSGKSPFCFLLFLSVVLFTLLPSFSSADPLDNWHWRDPLPQGNSLSDVAFGNGTFVAVGWSGTIMTSPDGIAWTVRTSGTSNWLNEVVFGNGIFVAVGGDGTILTSTDGIAWAARTSGTTSSIWGVAFGNGIFVAVAGDTILTSSDGTNWTVFTTGAQYVRFSEVAFGNGVFVAVGSGIFISSDAVAWRMVFENPPGFIVQGIVFGDGEFVATYARGCLGGCSDFGLLRSPDGVTWTMESQASLDFFKSGLLSTGKAYGNGVFVAVGSAGRIWTSPDGLTWTLRTVSVAPDDYYLRSVTYVNGTFFAFGPVGSPKGILASPDGVTWTTRPLPFSAPGTGNALYGLAFGNNTFVVVGDNVIFTSPDGVTWKESPTPTFFGNEPWSRFSLDGVAFGNGTFVAVGGGAIVTSPDGLTWTMVKPFGSDYLSFNASFEKVVFANNMFIALSNSAIWTSPDGVTWTARPSVANNLLEGLAYGNGVFVAVGRSSESAAILRSPDGVNWTQQDPGTEVFDLHDVAFGGGLFVAVGTYGEILTSVDGTTWKQRAAGSFKGDSLSSVAFGKGTFIAVGTAGAGIAILQSDPLIGTDIKANNSDGEIVLSLTDTLSVTAGLDAAGLGINSAGADTSAGTNADWWVIADTPMGLYYFTQPGVWYRASAPDDIRPAYQGPLFDLAPVDLLTVTGLPAGRYIFYFGIDTDMNGLLDYDHLYVDYVTMHIR